MEGGETCQVSKNLTGLFVLGGDPSAALRMTRGRGDGGISDPF
jgi:hypothetical protein